MKLHRIHWFPDPTLNFSSSPWAGACSDLLLVFQCIKWKKNEVHEDIRWGEKTNRTINRRTGLRIGVGAVLSGVGLPAGVFAPVGPGVPPSAGRGRLQLGHSARLRRRPHRTGAAAAAAPVPSPPAPSGSDVRFDPCSSMKKINNRSLRWKRGRWNATVPFCRSCTQWRAGNSPTR